MTRATFDWPVIDEELFSLMSLVREALNCGAVSTDEADSAFPDLIGAHPCNSDRRFFTWTTSRMSHYLSDRTSSLVKK